MYRLEMIATEQPPMQGKTFANITVQLSKFNIQMIKKVRYVIKNDMN